MPPGGVLLKNQTNDADSWFKHHANVSCHVNNSKNHLYFYNPGTICGLIMVFIQAAELKKSNY